MEFEESVTSEEVSSETKSLSIIPNESFWLKVQQHSAFEKGSMEHDGRVLVAHRYYPFDRISRRETIASVHKPGWGSSEWYFDATGDPGEFCIRMVEDHCFDPGVD